MTTRLSLFAGLFLLTGMLTSFNGKDPFSLTAKSIQQTMARITDDLYACKYEVSNAEYRRFLEHQKGKSELLTELYRVDSTKWLSHLRYGEPMVNYYHLHPAYNSYPVVCISYDAALAYCDWLSDQYNADAKRKFKKVRFFLPSEEQWMTVANGGNKNKMYPWSNYYLRNKAGEFLCNFKNVGDENISYDAEKKEYSIIDKARIAGSLSDKATYTASVNSFEAIAPYSIYNMSGNVAEMVKEKGIAKGGSYNSPGYDVRIQSKMNYTEASPEIGFRVFMEVINIETGELIKPGKNEKPASKKY